jgi:hypothetical protein
MRSVVSDISEKEEGPEGRVYNPIIDYHYFEESIVADCYD